MGKYYISHLVAHERRWKTRPSEEDRNRKTVSRHKTSPCSVAPMDLQEAVHRKYAGFHQIVFCPKKNSRYKFFRACLLLLF